MTIGGKKERKKDLGLGFKNKPFERKGCRRGMIRK